MECLAPSLESTQHIFEATLIFFQDNQLSFTVTMSHFRKGPIVLALFTSDFQKAVMPENVESMWGPVPFKALPPGTENKCDVASHR